MSIRLERDRTSLCEYYLRTLLNVEKVEVQGTANVVRSQAKGAGVPPVVASGVELA